MENSLAGIGIESSTNVTISGNTSTGIGTVSSSNVTISGNTFSASPSTYYAIVVGEKLSDPPTRALTIVNNTFTDGVIMENSFNSKLNITGNTFVSTNAYLSTGVSVSSIGAIVSKNKITGGRLEVDGNRSIVTDNLVVSGYIGVFGSGTVVRNNRADTIELFRATSITLSDNELSKGIVFSTSPPFDTPPFYDSDVMTGNTVNGKPIFYLARCSETSMDGVAAGEVIVASCANVRIANLRLYEPSEGVIMAYVHNATITGNNLSGNILKGIDILRSSSLEISRNNFNGTTVAISESDNVTLTSNVGVLPSRFAGITISGGSGLTLSNNTLEGAQNKVLSITDVTKATLTGNWISDNQNGIVINGANGLNVTANNFVRNAVGLTLDLGTFGGTFNTVIYHNNFVDNSQHQAIYASPVGVLFDNGYPSGGNYWSDNMGVDNCSGPLQNICSRPDGIGDQAYARIFVGYFRGGIPGNLTDRYPLVYPYGNFSWDTAAPTWTSESRLADGSLSSTSLSLEWRGATDDTWVSNYRVYEDGSLLATLPLYVHNYTVVGLKPGSTHTFKIEAGDLRGYWSTDGPSTTTILPSEGKPPPAIQLVSTVSWWMVHRYLGILVGGLLVLVSLGILLIQRKKTRTQL